MLAELDEDMFLRRPCLRRVKHSQGRSALVWEERDPGRSAVQSVRSVDGLLYPVSI